MRRRLIAASRQIEPDDPRLTFGEMLTRPSAAAVPTKKKCWALMKLISVSLSLGAVAMAMLQKTEFKAYIQAGGMNTWLIS
jgi:hypothetical protein